MENRKKNELAKLALAAFMISASVPAGAFASAALEKEGTILAHGCKAGACGAATPRSNTGHKPSFGSCGASAPSSNTGHKPSFGSCGASAPSSNTGHKPSFGSCGASAPSSNTGSNKPSFSGCGAVEAPSNRPTPESYRSRPVQPSDDSSMMEKTDGQSSYQGTTTGPGPNGGYPGTPRGSY